MSNGEVPVFLTKHEWDYIQRKLDGYTDNRVKLGDKKFEWSLLKKIDSQLGGNYPKNYTW